MTRDDQPAYYLPAYGGRFPLFDQANARDLMTYAKVEVLRQDGDDDAGAVRRYLTTRHPDYEYDEDDVASILSKYRQGEGLAQYLDSQTPLPHDATSIPLHLHD